MATGQAGRVPVARLEQLVVELRARLGAKLVAYILDRQATSALNEPATSEALYEDLARLEVLEEILIVLGEPDAVAAAWLFGMNPLLHDAAPARLLHEQGAAAACVVLAAAREHRR
jgi:hypothetical protein